MKGEIISMETIDKINLLEKQVEAQKEIIKVEKKRIEDIKKFISGTEQLTDVEKQLLRSIELIADGIIKVSDESDNNTN